MRKRLLILSVLLIGADSLSTLKVSIRQIKAARALVGWSQADLAKASGVSEPTLKRLESAYGDLGGRADTVAKIITALEKANIEFLAKDQASGGGGPGVRLKDAPEPAVDLGSADGQ